MTIRNIDESGFDEAVRTNSSDNHCSECDGQITTNSVEIVCEDYGLVIEEERIDHEPEWRAYDDDERERTGESGQSGDANGLAWSTQT
jgi:transcription initiation factor TFIIB